MLQNEGLPAQPVAASTNFDFWRQLPAVPRENVAEHLDFWTKTNLEIVSILDPLRQTPHHLRKVHLGESNSYISVDNRRIDSFRVINVFGNLFRNRRSTVDKVEFTHSKTSLNQEYIEKFETTKIKAKEVCFDVGNYGTQKFETRYSIFDESALEKVSLRYKSPSTLQAFTEKSYWKNGKHIEVHLMFGKPDFSILERAQKVTVKSSRAAKLDIINMIQSFRDRALPKGSFFIIEAVLDVNDMKTELENIPRSRSKANSNSSVRHTHLFEIPSNPENILIFKIHRNKFSAVVCLKKKPEQGYSAAMASRRRNLTWGW